MTQITTNGLRATWSGKDRWLSDGGSRGAGRLIARITRTGAHFFFQYVTVDGRKRLYPLGPFDDQGKNGLSLIEARERSAGLSALYRSGVTNIHAHFEQQRRSQAEREAVPQTFDNAQRHSLRALLKAYVEYLRQAGKQAAKDAENVFKNHVFSDALLPDLEASRISTEELVSLISKVVTAGHGRTAAKLRSYLHAAYALSIRAKTNPAAPQAMRDFDIKANPLASIDAMAHYNRALDRHLSARELAAFLKRVQAEPVSAMRDALEVCIYTGGQRPTQLLRLRRADVDLSEGVMTIYDLKGRRRQARLHIVPLTKHSSAILERRLANLDGDEPVFSTDGRTTMDRGTLTNLVTAISAEMVKSKESPETFTLRDLRRTLETLLASWGVSSDTRRHIQSHGLSGVQHRHYDRYEYLKEKRAALKLLASRLDRLLANRLPRRKSARNNRAQRQCARLEQQNAEPIASGRSFDG
jgi:integrase